MSLKWNVSNKNKCFEVSEESKNFSDCSTLANKSIKYTFKRGEIDMYVAHFHLTEALQLHSRVHCNNFFLKRNFTEKKSFEKSFFFSLKKKKKKEGYRIVGLLRIFNNLQKLVRSYSNTTFSRFQRTEHSIH